MDYKKKVAWGIIISVVGILIGYYLSSPIKHFVCTKTWCTKIIGGDVGMPLFLFSIALFFIFFIFLFIKEEIFNYWKKFAKIFLPVAIILIVITPTQYGGFVGIDKEMVTWILSVLFFIISIGIIIYQSIKLKKGN
jgi:hypothetical protein